MFLSNGPGDPEPLSYAIRTIRELLGKIPLFGICLGHQAIGQFFGAQLIKAIRPMHGKISAIYNHDPLLFRNMPDTIRVVRYHSLVLKKLPKHLKITSQTAEKEIMSFKHLHYPIHGIQFHPEALLTEYGINILENWATFNNIVH